MQPPCTPRRFPPPTPQICFIQTVLKIKSFFAFCYRVELFSATRPPNAIEAEMRDVIQVKFSGLHAPPGAPLLPHPEPFFRVQAQNLGFGSWIWGFGV